MAELEADLVARASELVAELDAELAALRDRRDRLNRTISNLAKKRLRYAAQVEDRNVRRLPNGLPSKGEGALLLLEEVSPRSMPLRQIHAELVQRGWSEDSQRDRHALEVAVRTLEHAGKVVRPRRGWYRRLTTVDAA